MSEINRHWQLTILSSVSSLINLAVPLVVVRIFSSAEMGSYKILFLYLSYLPWLSFVGAVNQSLYTLPIKEASKGLLYVNSFLFANLAALLLSILVGFSFLFFEGNPLSSILPEGFTWVLFAGVFCLSQYTFLDDYLSSNNKLYMSGMFSLFFDVAKAAAIIFSAIRFGDIGSVLIGLVIISIFKYLVSFFYMVTRYHWKSFKIDITVFRRIFKFCWPVTVSGLMSIFVLQFDQIYLSVFLIPEEFVIYSLGCLMLPFLFSFEISVSKVLVMDLTKALNEGDFESARSIFFASIHELFRILWPATLGLFAYSDQIVYLLYTETYMQSAVVLSLFSMTYLLMVIPFNAVARAQERTSFIMKIYAVSALIGISLIIFTVETFNYWGALVSIIIAQLSLRAFGLADTVRALSIRPGDLWRLKMLGFPFFSGLFLILCPGIIISQFEWAKKYQLLGFFVFGSLGALLYLYGNFRLRKPD